ncbi:MAG: Asp-tRNA(Asn)/Glu-tRNA(Gln) amidotransferase subunit GatB, partial [Planctomycetes bacterium]|nr:Asp-tRNA(Asn)/Glu-tRNA(Gln) amidotransferase subunit GatB [Planctomycetota bacterium]
PGSLPVVNETALDLGIAAALALGCELATYTKFDRKNYFYPDLPKGYQISQFDLPFARAGSVTVPLEDGRRKDVRLVRVHLEEDAGKLVHDACEGASLVDLNRAGIPLLEIVSQPDMESAEEAWCYLRALARLLRTLGVSDCNMEEGSLRCDANVSVAPEGARVLGVRTEIMNLNSFKNVKDAISHEAARHTAVLEAGGRVEQETRLWDLAAGETRLMRGKEEAHDYRYFPEPDLTPMRIGAQRVARVRAELPELPEARRRRFVERHCLSDYDAGVLTDDREVADYYEAVVAAGAQPKEAANLVTNQVLAHLGAMGGRASRFPVPPAQVAELIALVAEGTINKTIARLEVWPALLEGAGSPRSVVEARGLAQTRDEGLLRRVLEEAFASNPAAVADLGGGKEKARGWFVGQAMRATKGRADPAALHAIIDELLERRRRGT